MKKQIAILIGCLPQPIVYKRIELAKQVGNVHLICWDRGSSMHLPPVEDGYRAHVIKINAKNNSLYEHVERLICEPELREKLGRNAYQALANQWNADVAAERFLQLAQALLDGKSPELFEEGPCSQAKVLRNGWYKD